MKRIACVGVGLALALNGWRCPAQEDPISLERLQQHADPGSPSAGPGAAGQGAAGQGDADPLPAAPLPSAAGLVSSPPPSAVAPRAFDKTYALLNGLHLGLALADVEVTQHCIASHRCREANPLMPSSQAGQISINVGLFAYAAGSSYWLKKRKAKWWWAPPVVGIAAHAVGVASGLRNW